MSRKLNTIIALLSIIIILVLPIRIQAQGLVEYALILVVVGVGEGEKVEIYWARPGSATPQDDPPPSRFFRHDFIFTVGFPEDSTCTQVITTEEVEAHPGLNTLVVLAQGLDFIVNGELIETLDSCFLDAKRLVYQVGISPRSAQSNGSPPPKILGTTVIGPDGATRASRWSPADGVYLLLQPLSRG